MANLILNIAIREIDVEEVAEAFLRKNKMPTGEDGSDKYSSTREWVEKFLANVLLSEINSGKSLQSQDSETKMSKDIFI